MNAVPFYHLISTDSWSQQKANTHVTAPSLKTEGFIHCSFWRQLPRTLNKYFADSNNVTLLHLDPKKITSEIRIESNAQGDHFPHVYGPIPHASILKTTHLLRKPSGTFILPWESKLQPFHQSFFLRLATNNDTHSLRTHVHTILHEYGLIPDAANADADLEDIEASYQNAGGRFYILENASRLLVGCFGTFPLGDNRCELRKMYLTPSVRGLGLGKACLQYALEDARADGFQTVELQTASVLKEAIQLYKSHGFQKLNKQPPCGRCDQFYAMRLFS